VKKLKQNEWEARIIRFEKLVKLSNIRNVSWDPARFKFQVKMGNGFYVFYDPRSNTYTTTSLRKKGSKTNGPISVDSPEHFLYQFFDVDKIVAAKFKLDSL
jgi:hypothetical protein